MKPWHLIPILAGTVALTIFVSSTIAGPGTSAGMSAREIRAVSVVRLPGSSSTSFHGFEDVPGASTTFTVRPNMRRLVLARFTTDASCTNTDSFVGPLYCSARILISAGPGGTFVEMEPQPAGHFEVFVAHGESGARAMDRSYGPVGPGTYTVKVQYGLPFIGSVGTPALHFSFSHLTVERARM